MRGRAGSLLWIVCGGGRRSRRCRMRRPGGRLGGTDGRVRYRRCVERGKQLVLVSEVRKDAHLPH